MRRGVQGTQQYPRKHDRHEAAALASNAFSGLFGIAVGRAAK